MNKTYEEKTNNNKKNGIKHTDRQNTTWSEIVRKCNHEWQPVSFAFEVDGIRPDMENGRVYCVCMKCCGHTYITTGWVNFYIGSPDLLENSTE